jgi:hypothetical protein
VVGQLRCNLQLGILFIPAVCKDSLVTVTRLLEG